MPTTLTKRRIWVSGPVWDQFVSRATELSPRAYYGNAIDDAAEVALTCFIQLDRDEAIERLKRIKSHRDEAENTPSQGEQRMAPSENDHDNPSDDISKVLDQHLQGMQATVTGALHRREAIDAAVHHFCLMPWPESLKAMRNAHGRHLNSNWHEVTK